MKRVPAISRLTSIVAHAEHGAIGVKNRLPWRVRSDMRFFRDTTVDNVVIMGKRTYDSLGGCLPRRRNVVVTHGFELAATTEICKFASGIGEALALAASVQTKNTDLFVVGGATMYEQFSPFVDRYLVTKIGLAVPGADTFFNTSIFSGKDWIRNLILKGLANNEGDEADFEIVEYVSTKPSEFAARREDVLNEIGHHVKRSSSSRSITPASGTMDRLPL